MYVDNLKFGEFPIDEHSITTYQDIKQKFDGNEGEDPIHWMTAVSAHRLLDPRKLFSHLRHICLI